VLLIEFDPNLRFLPIGGYALNSTARQPRDESQAMDTVRFGVDIGGTFTDLVMLGQDGRVETCKVSSTPGDYGDGILAGIDDVRRRQDVDASAVADLVHASTVATNAILEHRGARTALVTTKGFRDVLEMRRLRIPVLYDLQYEKPPPLVPRHLRFEVDERLGPRGEVWRPLDEASVEAAAEAIREAEADAVAVALLHAHTDPSHERRVVALLRRRLGDRVYITGAADILPQIREYERTSTATVNAYVGPVVSRYLSSLTRRLKANGIAAPLAIMQSNGGIMTAEAATLRPASIVESGPAAGVIAAARLARVLDLPNVISFDMGGTTAKTAIVEGGEPAKTTEYEVGAGINLSSRLVKGGGYPIKLPFIDVSEIGAGGGSIVTLDSTGGIKVGPLSAGAVPGPACYGLGGRDATFTDAMVVLGYVNPAAIAGGRVAIDAARARQAVERAVAVPLGLSLSDAAFGVYAIAVASMTRAVKAVTTYRGRDPRDFVLTAFGGNGPVAAVGVAQALEISRVLVPPAPGVFSAFGLLFSEVEHEFVASRFRRLDGIPERDLAQSFADLEARAVAALTADGYAPGSIRLRRAADLRYAGQAYELTVPIAGDRASPVAVAEAFHDEHRRTYGHRSDRDPIDLITLKVLARVENRTTDDDAFVGALRHFGGGSGQRRSRPAYFGRDHGTLETPVIGRGDLDAMAREGPLIVEEYDATTVIPPGARGRLDGFGNIDIEVSP
jgi:N-methylhydantoinase A